MPQQSLKSFDIAIVGGGLVGCSLACALEQLGLTTVLIEAAESAQASNGFDQRKLALAGASIQALQSLSVLNHLKTLPTAIERIHVSRVGDFGRVILKSKDFGQTSFGAVVLAQDLGHALVSQVASLKNTVRLCPAQVSECRIDDESAHLRLSTPNGEQSLKVRFVVAADGTQSFIRQALGIGTQTHDYQQTLFVCSLKAQKASDGSAYERFSSEGPLALLPMPDGVYGSICGVAAEHSDQIAALDDDTYVEYLQTRFGWRVGKILQVGKRTHYPLKRVLAERISAPRAVLMGNAAQTIHPIGAQGFNLGLRDALTFAQLVGQYGLVPGLAEHYAQSRLQDREQTFAFSDGLARSTSNTGLPMQMLRSMTLTLLGSVPSLCSPIVAGAMGYRNANAFEAVL